MAKKPRLSLVGEASTAVQPPRTLGNHGRNLWDRIFREYEIGDAGGVEMLTQACQALDRSEALRAEIDRYGEVIHLRNGGVKENPALKAELANRAFVVRTLTKLGLNFESTVKPVGRPGQGIGWKG